MIQALWLYLFAWIGLLGQAVPAPSPELSATSIFQILMAGGSAGAVIAVVVLFLKKQSETEAKLEKMAEVQSKAIESAQKVFVDHNSSLFQQFEDRNKQVRDDMRVLVDRCIAVTQQVIIAVQALDTRVRDDQVIIAKLSGSIDELRNMLRQLQDEVRVKKTS